MGRRSAVIAVVMMSVIVTVARSGHEMPIYPSYYPHEIEFSTISPERAAALLRENKIHAYLGSTPPFAGPPSGSIGSVESLGSFVIVRVNPALLLARNEQSVCAVAETVIRALAAGTGGLIVHPYPVTPIHGDYLHHVDLAETAKARVLSGHAGSPSPPLPQLKIRAHGALANKLVPSAWRVENPEWDAEVSETSAADLTASTMLTLNGWLGPAWVRTGWFHAYLLLGNGAGDDEIKKRIETDLRRLQTGAYEGAVERINLERSLVTALTGDCRKIVAGYTMKREYFNTDFSAGIENIAYDSITGFNSPMFIRTVKLKDFPWNGWLALGIDTKPAEAWNPIAGFGDEFGRLMWSAVGDPAMVPSPYESAWMLNRITEVQSTAKR